MAKLFSYYAFDINHLDLNSLIRNQTDFAFLNNAYESYRGITYEDVVAFEYYSGGYARAYFGGKGITMNVAQTRVTGGTVNGVLEEVWTGSKWAPAWGIEKFSYSAKAMGDAGLTVQTADDYQTIQSVLSGADAISLSKYADKMRGYAGNDKIYGSGGNDTLLGDAGNDLLSGGSGKDGLTGGSGKDIFLFNTTLNVTTNIDVIKDFRSIDDVFQLENSIFKSLNITGQLKAAWFKANAAGRPSDTNDYIVYETDTGKLFYDPDGSGAAKTVQFATLTGHPSTSHTDFIVI